jgi:HSP20 family molecular chaperone IbpA
LKEALGDKLVVRAEMPGIDPKDVEVIVSGNMLTIRGKREERGSCCSGRRPRF